MPSFLQTDEWGKFKQKYGWRPQRFAGTLVLSRPVMAGRTLWYAPETEITDSSHLANLLTIVSPVAAAGKAFCFRLEIAVPYAQDIARRLKEAGFRRSFESVQPAWRAVLDIRPSEEQILAAMHQKGRYNIRVAEKHGVSVTPSDDIEVFYRLYLETARRDRFSPRPRAYFQDFLSMIPGAQLVVAKAGSAPLAAGLIVFHDGTASYLYGASSSERREVMAPYALHWFIIRRAKEKGCLSYDLGEIPPPETSHHPLKGLLDFKMKFGARPVQLMGSWDYVYQPFWYMIFRLAEKIRRGFRA